MIVLLENNIRGGISSVLRERYVKLNYNDKILKSDAIFLYGWASIQSLLYDKIKFHKNVQLEDSLKIEADNDVAYIHEMDLKRSHEIKHKRKHVPFCPRKKIALKMCLVKM